MSHERAWSAQFDVWCASHCKGMLPQEPIRKQAPSMQRYHPLLVALHWLMALMILVALAAGGLVLANMAPDSPDKVKGLGGHMIFGMAIGVLFVLRLITRSRSKHPPHAETGTPLLDRIGRWTHWGFYVLIAGMVLTGLATA